MNRDDRITLAISGATFGAMLLLFVGCQTLERAQRAIDKARGKETQPPAETPAVEQPEQPEPVVLGPEYPVDGAPVIIRDSQHVDLTPPPPPPPVPDEDGEGGPINNEGNNVLLVKPIAESSGKLVILLPAKWNTSIRDVWLIDQNGVRHDDGLKSRGQANGNRTHAWFRRPGSYYGRGTLVVTLDSGVRNLPMDFANRNESRP